MIQSISALDWTVIAVYLVFLILFAVWLSRFQNDREDYYVGGRQMGAWPVAWFAVLLALLWGISAL